MCEYSLACFPNRLAVEGEELIVHRFPTGSKGLASAESLPPKGGGRLTPRTIWLALHSFFRAAAVPAVCIPPGARLQLSGIPEALQQELGTSASEEVIFVELSAEAYQYRDAVRFENGRTLLLQRLQSGQRVRVLNLDSVEDGTVREESPIADSVA
jgi:hypothetical protein